MAPCFPCICFGLVSLVAAVVPPAYQSPPLETVIVASQEFVIDPANVILGGTTVSAGGPAVTVNGAIVFEDGNDDVFVNGIEVLTGPTATAKTNIGNSAQMASSSPSNSASGKLNSDAVTTSSGPSMLTTSPQGSSAGTTMSSALSFPGINSVNSSRDAMTVSTQSSPALTNKSLRNSMQSLSNTNISLCGVASKSVFTSSGLHHILGTASASSHSNPSSFASSSNSLTVSALAMNDESGGVKSKSISANSTLIQGSGTTSESSQDGSTRFETSSSTLTAATIAVDKIASSSATTSVSSSPSRWLSQSRRVTSLNGTASPKPTYSSLSLVSGSNPANASVSGNQTSNSELASSIKLNIAFTHSDMTAPGSRTSNSILELSASSTARTSVATSTTFATSTDSETNTLTALLQITIPTTSLNPADAAAIAGGLALGEGLFWLYNKGRSFSDESEFMGSKSEFINSIETLRSDMDRLSLDLGGDGSSGSCSGSKSRFRHRKRSIIGDLLGTITKAICSLSKLQVDIDAVPPDFGTMEADLVEIDGLASELTQEEEKEEEEEEEEKQSQSAEEQKTGASSVPRTSASNIPTTSASSVLLTSVSSVLPSKASRVLPSSVSSDLPTSVSSGPVSCYTGLIQAYPVDVDDTPAADAAVFAAVGAALFAVFGGSGDGGTSEANASISFMNSTSATRPTFDPKATTASIEDATASTTDRLTTSASGLSYGVFALASSSATITKKHWKPLPIPTRVPNEVKPKMTRSSLVQSVSASQISTSKRLPPAALMSQASISSASAASAAAASMSAASVSRASVLTASVSRASVSRASVSRASVSRAPLSAMSASAASEAAVSFPSQISSNQGSSSLCKSVGSSSCITAYSLYNSIYLYTEYTSYVHTTGGFDGEWLGWGCAAMFTCDNDTMYAHGMTGQQILNAFQYLYSNDAVEICGSIYMDNGCHLTVNACSGCESSMPCDALPTVDQPPKGDVPCYFNNGTTWPSDDPPNVPNPHKGLD